MTTPNANIDEKTVAGFGEEWDSFDQSALSEAEWRRMFDSYFGVFPFERLPDDAKGFDMGCGSGRWAVGVAPKVGILHCIDPSEKALSVARRRLEDHKNVRFHNSGVDDIPLPDDSQDFGYALGVLHHIPDSAAAMRDCVRKLKPGAPFLIYVYYAFDNRPLWFKALWGASDIGRRGISRLPFGLRKGFSSIIATAVYWPLARGARLAERGGMNVAHWPLSAYRNASFYTLRTDALDRFGTRLEQRFTRDQIESMMRAAGLTDIRFSDEVPFWVACGIKT